MLTGRPPFLGETPWDVLGQVLGSDPVPPRRLQPKVPADLETICSKCLEKEPGKRYASAAALADDLDRFGRGEPIHARPVGVAGRAWRWSRRNRRVSALLATLLLVVVGSLAGLTGLWFRAERQREQAEANFQDAFDAVDEYLTVVSEDRLLHEPGLQPLRRELLLKAQRYYEKFVENPSRTPGARVALAEAYHRLGAIHCELGEHAKGIECGDRAVADYEALIHDYPKETSRAIASNFKLENADPTLECPNDCSTPV